MTKKRRDEWERTIEQALMPGTYIGYRESTEFVKTVEAVRAKITPVIHRDGGAARAVALFEVFIAGCYEKAEEIDDSGGGFGQFVGELFRDWIRARQAAGYDADETVKWLHSWVKSDDYGYCHDLEKAAVAVLDRDGLRVLERTARETAEASGKDTYAHTRSIEVLKAIHAKRGAVRAYETLCDAEEDLEPADCEKLAEMSLKRRKLEDALVWVERGLELEQTGNRWRRSAWRLPDLKREVLKRLGRNEDALASAWVDYCRMPSVYSYEDLMKFVPKGERREWNQKALVALAEADLSSRIELLVKMKEWDLLAAAVDAVSREELIALSHHITDPAARGLARAHPLLAAKLDIAMALRILEAKKSKYYDTALRNLEQARKAMLKSGRPEEWETLAEEIRTNHRRKSGFMPGFERLAAGRSTRGPSFAERARRRWRQGARGGSA
jgi:hypothetical protein